MYLTTSRHHFWSGLGPIHAERLLLRLRHRWKWVTWSSMGQFTFSDGEHQRKGNVAIAIASAVAQCAQALNEILVSFVLN